MGVRQKDAVFLTAPGPPPHVLAFSESSAVYPST